MDLALLASIATFLFSLVLLGLIDYLLFYFKHSVFAKTIQAAGVTVFFITVSRALSLLVKLDYMDAGSGEAAAQVLFICAALSGAWAISSFKHAFEDVEWLREQWLQELRARYKREHEKD